MCCGYSVGLTLGAPPPPLVFRIVRVHWHIEKAQPSRILRGRRSVDRGLSGSQRGLSQSRCLVCLPARPLLAWLLPACQTDNALRRRDKPCWGVRDSQDDATLFLSLPLALSLSLSIFSRALSLSFFLWWCWLLRKIEKTDNRRVSEKSLGDIEKKTLDTLNRWHSRSIFCLDFYSIFLSHTVDVDVYFCFVIVMDFFFSLVNHCEN